jgi:hypothetical protein
VKQHIVEMLGGPGTLRFLVQPSTAILLGLLHGVRDRRAGQPPLLMAIIRDRSAQLDRLYRALRAIAFPLSIALISSLAFQSFIRARIHFWYGVLYALLFVAIPYFLARGAACRVPRRQPPSSDDRSRA